MNIVLVGIGGAGMSSIAYICQRLGYKNLIGIDKNKSQLTQKLTKQGINIIIGHGKYIPQKEDYVIYSQAAINSPEVQQSFEYEKMLLKHYHKPFSYFEFVGEISKYFKTISICGTHGKSTSTALMIYTLKDLAKDFGIGIVGALMPQLNNENYYINPNLNDNIKNIFDHIFMGEYQKFNHELIKKYYFIIESCEYNRHFLYIDPDYAGILNIELDHSDIFHSYEEYLDAYAKFALNVRHNIWGLENDQGMQSINDLFNNKTQLIQSKVFEFDNLFGEHNNLNASIVYTMIKKIFPKIPDKKILAKFKSFAGIWRRMEHLGNNQNSTPIYTDYAHHPSEIEAVYNGLKERFPKKNLITIFQPHQARRVLEFWDRFINTLKKFDSVYIFDIYTARENLDELITTYANGKFEKINNIKDLGEQFANETNGEYIENFNIATQIIEKAGKEDLIVIITAGNLDFQIRERLKNLK